MCAYARAGLKITSPPNERPSESRRNRDLTQNQRSAIVNQPFHKSSGTRSRYSCDYLRLIRERDNTCMTSGAERGKTDVRVSRRQIKFAAFTKRHCRRRVMTHGIRTCGSRRIFARLNFGPDRFSIAFESSERRVRVTANGRVRPDETSRTESSRDGLGAVLDVTRGKLL